MKVCHSENKDPTLNPQPQPPPTPTPPAAPAPPPHLTQTKKEQGGGQCSSVRALGSAPQRRRSHRTHRGFQGFESLRWRLLKLHCRGPSKQNVPHCWKVSMLVLFRGSLLGASGVDLIMLALGVPGSWHRKRQFSNFQGSFVEGCRTILGT